MAKAPRSPRVPQRDLIKTMKAARAAGIESFDLVDPATGLIFRARTGSSPFGESDLDDELRRFESRHG